AAKQQIIADVNQFATPAVAAESGDSLTFTNTDIASHNITSVPAGQFGTKGNVAPGSGADVWGVSKLKPGQYQFVCTLHPGMTGILYVGTTGAPSTGGVTPPSGGGGGGGSGSGSGSGNPASLLPAVAPAKLTGDWPF